MKLASVTFCCEIRIHKGMSFSKNVSTIVLQDSRRKVDFVLVYEEDKKDVDIEIPKVSFDLISTFFFTLILTLAFAVSTQTTLNAPKAV